MADSAGSARQRLYNAATGWYTNERRGPEDLIDAACTALIDGLDSPTLRDVAGAPARDPSWHIHELASAALNELDIPAPGTLPPGRTAATGGGIARREATDTLDLTVTPAPAQAGGGFQVEVWVNGSEMTSAGAGLGMTPYDLLVPTNRLVASTTPHTVGITRCECGVYGCGSTDVTIVRDGDAGHWDWSIDVPADDRTMLTTACTGTEMVGVRLLRRGRMSAVPVDVDALFAELDPLACRQRMRLLAVRARTLAGTPRLGDLVERL